MKRHALRLTALVSALWLAGCASPGAPVAPRPLIEPVALGATGSAVAWPAERWWWWMRPTSNSQTSRRPRR